MLNSRRNLIYRECSLSYLPQPQVSALPLLVIRFTVSSIERNLRALRIGVPFRVVSDESATLYNASLRLQQVSAPHSL